MKKPKNINLCRISQQKSRIDSTFKKARNLSREMDLFKLLIEAKYLIVFPTSYMVFVINT